jgi:hypothetical protein
VRALELHHRARLALEPRDDIRLLQRLWVEKLQRDALVESKVMREHDRAHPAAADQPLDAIFGAHDGANGRPLGFHERNLAENERRRGATILAMYALAPSESRSSISASSSTQYRGEPSQGCSQCVARRAR